MSIRVTFISNALTPHQIPFSEAMYKLIGENYKFISCVPLSSERKEMGWDSATTAIYELKTYESINTLKLAESIIEESDVVIIGTAPDSFILNRLKKGKLTFKYSERLYKRGLSFYNFPRAMVSSYLHHGRFQKYPIYMLCASGYTAGDLNVFKNYKNRTFKWGYFPEIREYNVDKLMDAKKSKTINILWAGRFINLKHPEHALNVAEALNKENIDFQLRMIGNGEEFEKVKNKAKSIRLKRPIELLGMKPPSEVRKYMEEANIYLFTSDFNEGWGAVLNESMNSGCAVVASHAIGAVPFLLNHGENGLIYKNKDVSELCRNVIQLAKDRSLCERIGRNAYYTIKNLWNPNVAAERFLNLAEGILEGNEVDFLDGPCSKAKILKNEWGREGF